jgi:hypothetical protein
MDRLLKCPKCQHVFAVGEGMQNPSVACPQCGFPVTIAILTAPMPASEPAASRQSWDSTGKITIGCLLGLGGIGLLLCGLPAAFLTMVMERDPGSKKVEFVLGSAACFAAFACIGGGIVLRKRKAGGAKQRAEMAADAIFYLILMPLAGEGALTFALAVCNGP